MDITHISKEYMVRRITEKDAEQVYMLEIGNPMYFEFCPPEPSREAVLEDMKALPPNTTYDDKFYIGFYKYEQLIAVMDLIYHYPNENTAFFGFFMMNRMYQGKGRMDFFQQELKRTMVRGLLWYCKGRLAN